jgi:hypothetical protein
MRPKKVQIMLSKHLYEIIEHVWKNRRKLGEHFDEYVYSDFDKYRCNGLSLKNTNKLTDDMVDFIVEDSPFKNMRKTSFKQHMVHLYLGEHSDVTIK